MQYETSYLIFRDDDLYSEYYRDLLEGDMSREHDSEFLEDDMADAPSQPSGIFENVE